MAGESASDGRRVGSEGRTLKQVSGGHHPNPLKPDASPDVGAAPPCAALVVSNAIPIRALP